MRKFYSSFITSIVFLQFLACKKETIIPIDFSNYTVTDSSCTIVVTTDPSDWSYDTTWTSKESSLMNFADNILIVDSLPGNIELSPACPNPSDGLFIIGINTERECKMKLACVNTEMETLYFLAKRFSGGPIVTGYDLRSLTAFHKDMNYRMYYAFYNSKDSLYYKGHGDFRIE
jgi:hypothetical protein